MSKRILTAVLALVVGNWSRALGAGSSRGLPSSSYLNLDLNPDLNLYDFQSDPFGTAGQTHFNRSTGSFLTLNPYPNLDLNPDLNPDLKLYLNPNLNSYLIPDLIPDLNSGLNIYNFQSESFAGEYSLHFFGLAQILSQKGRKPNRLLRLFNRRTLSSLVSIRNPTSLRLDKLTQTYPLALSLLAIPSASIPPSDPTVTDFKYSVHFSVAMLSPAPVNGNLVEHRRDARVILEIKIRPRSIGVDLPWNCIRIPQTKSVKRSITGNKKALCFRLEVRSATTGTLRDSLCRTCTEREPRNTLIPQTLVDFTSKTDIIDLKNGEAKVAFRFLCLSTHHGPADSEYR
jgi:hypothetical protein